MYGQNEIDIDKVRQALFFEGTKSAVHFLMSAGQSLNQDAGHIFLHIARKCALVVFCGRGMKMRKMQFIKAIGSWGCSNQVVFVNGDIIAVFFLQNNHIQSLSGCGCKRATSASPTEAGMLTAPISVAVSLALTQ